MVPWVANTIHPIAPLLTKNGLFVKMPCNLTESLEMNLSASITRDTGKWRVWPVAHIFLVLEYVGLFPFRDNPVTFVISACIFPLEYLPPLALP